MISLLATGDWQCSLKNLENCRTVLEQILSIVKREHCQYVIHLGDLTEHRNPIDVRVTNFFIETTQRITAAGAKFLVLRGNHDSITTQDDVPDCLPVVAAAGAEIAVHQYWKRNLGEGINLYMVPYFRDPERQKEAFKAAYSEARSERTIKILAFHNEVQGCKVTPYRNGTGLSLGDLGHQYYDLCIGGHIHGQQRLAQSHVWYTGSPFCCDWGEVNERKGFLLLRKATAGTILNIMPIASTVPGWFDPEAPGFEENRPANWNNCQVRIHVPVNADSARDLAEARRQWEPKYKGATLHLVPEFQTSTALEEINIKGSDEQLLRNYLEKTVLPPDMTVEQLVAYLKRFLPSTGLLGVQPLKFLNTTVSNVLCFDHVALSLDRPGLTLVTGFNHDWGANISNGCVARGTYVDCPRNLTRYPYGIPIEELVGKQPLVYCYSHNLGRIVLRKASWIKKTGTEVPVVKVRFTDPFGDPTLPTRLRYRPQKKRGRRFSRATEFLLTADHLVMLRNGEYKPAGELEPGDRIMPFYRRVRDGSYWSINLNDGTQELESRFILAELAGKRSHLYQAHHKDENRSNHSPGNLEWKTSSEHASYHLRKRNLEAATGWQKTGVHPHGMLGKKHSQKTRKLMSKALKGRFVSGSTCKLLSKINTGKMLSPETRARISKAKLGVRLSKKARRLISRSMKALWKSRISKKWREQRRSPKYRERTSLALKEFFAQNPGYGWTPERRTAQAGRMRKLLDRRGKELNHKVLSVEKAGKAEVYDLHVPTVHNFVANGVVVHNSGKSSLVSLPFLAMFGHTFKGQAFDSWASNEGGVAVATSELQLPTGERIKIHRGRRPPVLRLFRDSKEITMGDANATQALIESITNVSWEVLTSAVYVGQQEIGTVFGTDKERKELFSRLLGLNRFLEAQEKLRKVLLARQRNVDAVQVDLTTTEAALAEARSGLQEMQRALAEAPKADTKRIADLQLSIAKLMLAIKRREEENAVQESWLQTNQKEFEILLDKGLTADGRARALTEQLEKSQKLGAQCPLCGNKVKPDHLRQYHGELKDRIDLAEGEAERYEKQQATNREARRVRQDTIQRNNTASIKDRHIQAGLQQELIILEQQKEARQRLLALVEVIHQRCKELERNQHVHSEAKTACLQEQQFVQICVDTVGRNGLPAYLCSVAAPQLNAAASRYSQIFAEGEIGVQFTLAGGEIEVAVHNLHGGTGIKDQSVGEMRMAGLIAAFAFREILVPHNILILDEPGAGLDAENAARFARGLKQIADRFGSVFLISHDLNMLAGVEPDYHLTVTKRNGVATVTEEK